MDDPATDSKKAPIAWTTFYHPKVAGGWNLIDMTLWNKAARGTCLQM